MRLSVFIILLTFLSLIGSNKCWAQFSINAQIRNRAEYRNGYKNLVSKGTIPSILISQRTRICFLYETDNLKIKYSPQDVRIWGDENLSSSTGVYGDNASLTLFEGFADIKILQSGWLAIGRQQLVYDNQRLLAARNWNQNGLAYDAAVFKLALSSWNIHIGSSWNSISDSKYDNLYPTTRIKSLNYLWLNYKSQKNLGFSILHLSTAVCESDSTNQLFFRHTSGLFSKYKKENFNFWGNAYYQYGKNQKGLAVSAFLIDADLSYKVEKLIAGLGIGFLSGNSKTGSNQVTDHLFDNLYGARHKYFGSIDYFSSFASHTNQGGLADYYFYLNYQISKSFCVKNTSHYFQLAQTNNTTPEDKNLGFENDVVLKYKFNDWGAFESGYSFFLPTESIKSIQKVNEPKISQFFYLQLTITPTLFTHKKVQL